jgi:hypothetical protein
VIPPFTAASARYVLDLLKKIDRIADPTQRASTVADVTIALKLLLRACSVLSAVGIAIEDPELARLASAVDQVHRLVQLLERNKLSDVIRTAEAALRSGEVPS